MHRGTGARWTGPTRRTVPDGDRATTIHVVVLVAALLVLAGLGLFVLGVTTAVTAWYWACVAACGLAAALLVVARLRGPAADDLPLAAGGDDAGRGARAARTAERPAVTAERPAGERPADERPADRPATTGERPAIRATAGTGTGGRSDPAEEDVEVTDLLTVVDLSDEVLVVDEHPRYHLAGCRWLGGRETIPIPVREARTDGFTPCAVCSPDAHLAAVERTRRAARRG